MLVEGDVCIPVACGTAPFGDVTGDAIFVANPPLGSETGDGSRDAPMARIDPAVDLAFTSGVRVVRLAGDIFEGTVSFGRTGDGVRLVGRCPDLTILDAGGALSATVTVHANGVQLSGLTVTGGAPGIAVLPSDGDGVARLAADNLLIRDNRIAGLVVSGNGDVEADIRDSTVTNTEPRSDEGEAAALLVEGGARLGAVSVEIQPTVGVGVRARGEGSVAELDDVRVIFVEAYPDGRAGSALRATESGTILGSDIFTSRTIGRSAYASGAGSLIELDESVLQDSVVAPNGSGGESVVADQSGRVVLRSSTTLLAAGTGWWATDGGQIQGIGTTVNQTTVVNQGRGAVAVRIGEAAIVSGDGLLIGSGAGPAVALDRASEFQCDDCLIRGREFAGVVAGPGSTVRLNRGEVVESRVSETLGGGIGILALSDGFAGPSVEILGTGLSDHAGPAVLIQGGPARVLLSGATVERSGSGGSDLPRSGLVARDDVAVWTGDVGAPDAAGLWIRDTLFRDLGGDGILLDSSSARIESNTFEDVGGVSLRMQSCRDDPEIVGPTPNAILCDGPLVPLGPAVQYPQ